MTTSYKKYRSGFVLGKYLPFHTGHKFLIDFATLNCDKVTVLVGSLKREPIPGEIRFKWLKETYKDNPNVTIVHCSEELPQTPEEHPDFWKIWVDVAKRYCPADIDVIFDSELYGQTYAHYLGIANEMIDLDRKIVSVSGTKIRKNPFVYWEYIPPAARTYFTKRVAILGTESCGKSILTKKLAEAFKTNYVEEYGRTLFEDQDGKLSIEDFVKISENRQVIENAMIRQSNKILFCDTEDLTTWMFAQMYYPDQYTQVADYFKKQLDEKNKYDLYILLKPDCDAVQDGTRQFLKDRERHHNQLKVEMIVRGYNFVEIGGDWVDRFVAAQSIVNDFWNSK